jgi:arylsulfatase A-like enzyme
MHLIAAALGIVTALILGLAHPLEAADAKRPNIVIILADDLGQGDLGAYNAESKIATPNLDRLASQGRVFTDAHTPSSVCTPTRYGLLTGRYAWRSRLKSGVLWGLSPALIEEGRPTIASFLAEQGYVTAGFGKWHLGLGNKPKTDYTQPLTPGPTTVGFQTYRGIPASLDMEPYVWINGAGVEEQPTARTPGSRRRWDGGGGYWRAGPMAPSFDFYGVLPKTVDHTVEYIAERGKQADQPFFIYVPLSSPHTPWMPTEEFQGKTTVGWYGDFVHQTDAEIGRILKALDEAKLAENSLVVVTSDNGSHWRPQDIQAFQHEANNGVRGMKADIWEGGHRVPFIVRWPGHVPPASRDDETICLTDLFATVAAIVDVPLPEKSAEDSVNILPAMLGARREGPLREAIVHHSLSGMFAIRQGEWKLALGLGSGGFSDPRSLKPTEGGPQGQLFNLADDPKEENNLWLQEPEVVERLTTILNRYRESGRSVER